MNQNPKPNDSTSSHSSYLTFVSRLLNTKKKWAIFVVGLVLFFTFFPFLFQLFVFEAYRIPTSAMQDTLQIGDRIFVNKFIYYFSPIEVGDIVVYQTKGIPEVHDPDKPYFVKRVVGLPGDEIEITEEGRLKLNGEWLTDPRFFIHNQYVPLDRNSKKRIFTVPLGEVYVFGDNSHNSDDSRRWGGVPVENVLGKVAFRYWPLHRFGTVYGEPAHAIDDRST